jgi:N-acetyl-beta-hexosaminidase
MKHLLILIVLLISHACFSQEKNEESQPIRGFCIVAPSSTQLDRFLQFVSKELVPRKVNTLILRVDYNYEYKSHPELRDANPLTKTQVKQILDLCKKNGIMLIPQINLLGHQSWANHLNNLLTVYPQFDETPHVKMPEKYVWPNEDSLYCKSYCPLHPEVHKVVFDLVDEVMEVFEANGFHAGMDEVFYIGDANCPRCGGKDKAELFAGELTTIRNHLAAKKKQLWIWGDRLLDGKTTGVGMWEGSTNNTFRAIELIPKDIMICDWHYAAADPVAQYFAMKGFDVVTCVWNKPAIALTQVEDFKRFKKNANPELSKRYKGMMQTIWSDAGSFMDLYYSKDPDPARRGERDCFVELMNAMKE